VDGGDREGKEVAATKNKTMNKPNKTQCATILSHLKRRKSITTVQAVDKYRILRLGARIWEMERRGVICRHETVKAGSARIAKYTLLHA
jgi:hypothetical protein